MSNIEQTEGQFSGSSFITAALTRPHVLVEAELPNRNLQRLSFYAGVEGGNVADQIVDACRTDFADRKQWSDLDSEIAAARARLSEPDMTPSATFGTERATDEPVTKVPFRMPSELALTMAGLMLVDSVKYGDPSFTCSDELNMVVDRQLRKKDADPRMREEIVLAEQRSASTVAALLGRITEDK